MKILFWLIQMYFYTSGSWGLAVFPQDGLTATELLQSADTAMYKAKSLGKNRVCFFDHKDAIMLKYNSGHA